MAKVLTCKTIFPSCDFEVRSPSQDEILQIAALHAKLTHQIEVIDEPTAKAVLGAIRDDGGR